MNVLEHIAPTSASQAAILVLFLYFLYGIGLAIYRLWLSPLSKFPGPKLAALTLWYEFYFDVVKRGKFAWEIKRMHEVYGPIVRINPHELHVSDPDFYDELYTSGARKRNKHWWSADMFGIPGAMISTVPHDIHRRLRAPIAPFFSQQAIRKFDPVIREKLEIMCTRFEGFRGTGQPVNIEDAYNALTNDIISEYSFGLSHGCLDMPNFNNEWVPLLMGSSENSLLHKQIPWITGLMRNLPLPLLLKIEPRIWNFVRLQESIETKIKNVKDDLKNKPRLENDQTTIFHTILTSDLPASDLSPGRLLGEGQTLIAAGTLTTAHMLKTTTYHILANPAILHKLKAELEQAIPNPAVLPPFQDLDQLTYLNAVINEGFRISHGIIARLTRVAPDENLVLNDQIIPAGTPIGMSSWLLHLNPNLFPEPNVFRPERWLEPGANKLKKYLVNFTKGSRACLGKDLARTEIVYTLSTMFRRFEMELFETDRSDVDIVHDLFNPYPRMGSKGVRVVFV